MKKLILLLALTPCFAFGQNVFVTNSATKAVNVILRDTSGNYVAQNDILQNPFEQTPKHRRRYDLDELMQVQGGNVFVTNSATKAVNVILRDTAGAYVDASGGGGASISDTAYNAGTWDAVTTIGPSKNAVRDKIEALQPLDADLTSWAAITRGTGFDTAAALNVGSAGAFVTFNGAGGTPSSLTGTNISGTASSLTAGNVTNVSVATTFASDNTAVPKNIGGWTEYFVTGSNYVSGTALADVTGLVSGTLSASTKYEIEIDLDILMSADTNGGKIAISCNGTGSTGVVSFVAIGSSTNSTTVGQYRLDTSGVGGTNFGTTSAQTASQIGRGFFTTRSTGTITVSVQAMHTTSGSTTVNVGSVMRIRKANP